MKKNEAMADILKSLRSTTAFLKRHGCTPCKGHYGSGFHEHSGFFTSPKGLLWYWMTGDDRWNNNILFRRAKHLKDYTGERNQYPKTGDEFDDMINWHDRYEKAGTPAKASYLFLRPGITDHPDLCFLTNHLCDPHRNFF